MAAPSPASAPASRSPPQPASSVTVNAGEETSTPGRRKAFGKMRGAVSKVKLLDGALGQFQQSEGIVEQDNPPTREEPPPINAKTQRPLRRRNGPEWACVDVLGENDEKGPSESIVCCRFCGQEFFADTARIREHVENIQTGQPEMLLDEIDFGKFMQVPTGAPAPAGTPSRAPSAPVAISPAAIDADNANAQLQPPPPCNADLTPNSKAEHEMAIAWLKDHDFLRFATRVGVSVTGAVATARRKAEVAEARAIMYPSSACARTGLMGLPRRRRLRVSLAQTLHAALARIVPPHGKSASARSYPIGRHMAAAVAACREAVQIVSYAYVQRRRLHSNVARRD